MTINYFEKIRLNAEKSLILASKLFHHGKWIPHGEDIFVAKSCFSGGQKEMN